RLPSGERYLFSLPPPLRGREKGLVPTLSVPRRGAAIRFFARPPPVWYKTVRRPCTPARTPALLGLLLILVLIAVGVGVLLAAGTAVVQGYLYSEPTDGLEWRAPAAGAAVGLFFALWCAIEAHAPGQYDT